MRELLELGLCGKYFPDSVQHMAIGVFAVLTAGYLLGSLNFGVIISRIFYHDDVRKYGSNGSGMANVLRTYGKLPAAMTFLGDGLKAAAAVFIGALLLGSAYGPYIGGMASVIGHAFPLYHGFKGGKSIAAAFFMALCTSPLAGLVCFLLYLTIVLFTKYSSLGSILSVLAYPFVLGGMTGYGPHVIISAFIALFIVFLHRSNIKRLFKGNENKLTY